jgi:hypothetical protein
MKALLIKLEAYLRPLLNRHPMTTIAGIALYMTFPILFLTHMSWGAWTMFFFVWCSLPIIFCCVMMWATTVAYRQGGK